jgi:ribosomal protein S18 acetylase RimI-like enzyme
MLAMTSVPGVAIRPATDEDAEQIGALYAELHADEWGDRAPHRIDHQAWVAEARAVLAGAQSLLLVATAGGLLVGTVRVDMGVRPFGAVAEVRRLVVTRDWRRRGVARLLMAAAEEHAQSQGAVDVRLTVVSANAAARRLYEQLGYGEFAVRYLKPLG